MQNYAVIKFNWKKKMYAIMNSNTILLVGWAYVVPRFSHYSW